MTDVRDGPPSFEGRVLQDRWEVGPRIGAGGMATVYAGTDRRLGRPVACKILHPHIAEIPEARERLAREARAIAQLKHENVIEVYDYSIEDPHCTWLVTELIEGGTLRQFQDRHDRPMPEIAVMIATEVVRALRAAHEVGVIHRDVKPDNILIGKSGRPKLSDFGIAKVLNESKMTMTGNLVGSPSYMSPEQADGLHTDHRTDLYSVGILLYRLVTGTLPFRGASPLETIRLVSRGEYVDPADLAPQSAGAVAGIIRRALTVDIEERYQTADEMLADLVQVLQDAGLSATSEVLPQYFADPTGYESALRPKLARELEVRGKALLEAGEESRAVDCFNRALTLGDGSQQTFDLVEQLSKRRKRGRVGRMLWTAGIAIGAAAMVAAGIVAIDLLSTEPHGPAIAQTKTPDAVDVEPIEEVAAAPSDTAEEVIEPPVEATPPTPEPEAETEVASEAKAEPEPAPTRRRRVTRTRRTKPVEAEPAPTVREAPPEAEAKFGTLHVGTKVWADLYIDGHKVGRAPEQTRYPLPPGTYRLRAIQPNSSCIPFERTFTIRPGQTERMRLQIACP
ncbi:MAG: protein kinase [Deltaproteobacteria bacterium]|jgi:hypothetical protein